MPSKLGFALFYMVVWSKVFLKDNNMRKSFNSQSPNKTEIESNKINWITHSIFKSSLRVWFSNDLFYITFFFFPVAELTLIENLVSSRDGVGNFPTRNDALLLISTCSFSWEWKKVRGSIFSGKSAPYLWI